MPGDSRGAATRQASESFTRDLDGNLTTLVDYDSRTTNYGYDLFSLETGETWYTSADTLTNTIGYTYNVLQQMTGGSETYADISGGGSYGVNSSLALVYNLAGNETGETQSMAGRCERRALGGLRLQRQPHQPRREHRRNEGRRSGATCRTTIRTITSRR